MTAAVEVGAVRWVIVTTPPAEEAKWIETSSKENDVTTSSREPPMATVTVKAGELEPFPPG